MWRPPNVSIIFPFSEMWTISIMSAILPIACLLFMRWLVNFDFLLLYLNPLGVLDTWFWKVFLFVLYISYCNRGILIDIFHNFRTCFGGFLLFCEVFANRKETYQLTPENRQKERDTTRKIMTNNKYDASSYISFKWREYLPSFQVQDVILLLLSFHCVML